MSQEFNFTYTLNKAYFIECFEQSDAPKPWHQRFAKTALMMGIGILLIAFVPAENKELSYAKYFVFALGVLELVSTIYRKQFWLWRQQISKAANTQVELSINEHGIFSKTLYGQSRIVWSVITQLEETEKGLVVHHQQGKHYLSYSHLNDEAVAVIKTNVARLTSDV